MLHEPKIECIKVARLVPGDVLVLKCPQILSERDRRQLVNQILDLTPDGVRVVVLEGGMDMEVLRKAEENAPAS